VQAVLDADENMAGGNKKRQTMVNRELSAVNFPDKSRVVSALMGPVDYSMNFLMERAHNLCELSKGEINDAADNERYASECRESFLTVVSGDLGEKVIRMYMQHLKDFRNLGSTLVDPNGYGLVFFQHCLFAAAEFWRRFNYVFMSFPFCMFGLLDTDLQSFLEKWRLLKGQHTSCAQCVDAEFSSVLFEMSSSKHVQSISCFLEL
jgi:hypothetical protein